jgi:hypothetical protein
MKQILDEATIRGIVRQRLIGRMLTEVEGTPDGPTLNLGGVLGLFGIGGGSEEVKAKGEVPLGAYTSSGRVRGEDPISEIARIVGGSAQRDPATGAFIIDDALGKKVKSFIDGMKYVDRPFTVTETDKVLSEWSESAGGVPAVVPIGPDGKPDSGKEKVDFPPSADGLVRYLLVVQNAELGYRAMIEDMTSGVSDYKVNLEPIAQRFVEMINYRTYPEHLHEIATEVLAVAKGDKSPQMIRTKTLLAGFTRENSTTYELLQPVGFLALAVGLGVAAFYTGGAALAAVPAYTASFGTAVGLSAVSLAAGVAAAWGASAAYESAISVFSEEPYADVVSHINEYDQDYLNELAVEVERTVFPISRGGASFRDRLVPTLRRISAKEPNRSLIMRELTELVNERVE